MRDRRSGPRRTLDLPRSPWRAPLGFAVAAALGIAGALLLSSWSQSKVIRPEQPALSPRASSFAPVDPELIARAEALRDEAEALTPAGIRLDEVAQELWAPRLAMLDIALADPTTPPPLRRELQATLEAALRAGIR